MRTCHVVIRRVVVLSLVACASTSRPAESPPSESVPEPEARPAPSLAPRPVVHALREAREAPHGAAIQVLALSADGRIALTADELGGVRLWPTLDGTREPRIVEMPRPIQLAVGRRDGGYIAAGRDEAGGVYIAKLDDEVRQIAHVTLPAEPAVSWIGITERGLLAWRSDQRLVLIDADGAVLDELATEPRQSIVAIAVSGTRAVVLLDRSEGGRAARWLAIGPTLEWGAWLALDEPLLGDVALALAPNGKRLAALVLEHDRATASVLELATGKRIGGGDVTTRNATIGFVDDDRVAFGGLDGMWWIDLTSPDGKPTGHVPMPVRPQPTLGTGAGHAVLAHHGELALHTLGNDPKYLGYDTITPRIAEVGPDGRVLIGQRDRIVLLDRELRAEATPFSSIGGRFVQLRWLGGSRWLLERSSVQDDKIEIDLLELGAAPRTLRSGTAEVQLLSYEPSTELVTLSFGASPQVARFDRAANALRTVATAAKRGVYEEVLFVPVSPELAGGIQLVQIRLRERMTIDWLRDPSALGKPTASVTVEGSVAGADAAGHVYVWQVGQDGKLELALYKDGQPLRTLPNRGPGALWPEPRGRGYVEVTASSVARYDIDGAQKWQQTFSTSLEALWLTDGALAITSGAGIARLDGDTGAVTAVRCGWHFGLSTTPHGTPPRTEPLCAQLQW